MLDYFSACITPADYVPLIAYIMYVLTTLHGIEYLARGWNDISSIYL